MAGTGTTIDPIETARLRLRRHVPDDMAARIAMTGDEETMRHVGGPQTVEENWARILRYNGHWALFGYGLYALEEKAGGAFIGEAGLGDFHRELGPDFDLFPEAAWVLASAAHGKGYATEAMSAAITDYETRFGATRMVCVIAHQNVASLRLAEKLGFAVFAERPYKGAERLLLARPASADFCTGGG